MVLRLREHTGPRVVRARVGRQAVGDVVGRAHHRRELFERLLQLPLGERRRDRIRGGIDHQVAEHGPTDQSRGRAVRREVQLVHQGRRDARGRARGVDHAARRLRRILHAVRPAERRGAGRTRGTERDGISRVARLHRAPLARVDVPHALVVVVAADDDLQLVVERGESGRQAHAELFVVPFFGLAAVHGALHAVDALLEDEVHHAGDRIGAVGRGRAAGDDLDALDHLDRH